MSYLAKRKPSLCIYFFSPPFFPFARWTMELPPDASLRGVAAWREIHGCILYIWYFLLLFWPSYVSWCWSLCFSLSKRRLYHTCVSCHGPGSLPWASSFILHHPQRRLRFYYDVFTRRSTYHYCRKCPPQLNNFGHPSLIPSSLSSTCSFQQSYWSSTPLQTTVTTR